MKITMPELTALIRMSSEGRFCQYTIGPGWVALVDCKDNEWAVYAVHEMRIK